MRLIDKDKLLEELIEGQKAGLGLIEDSEYDNINSIDDAIEAIKYADEIDLSEHDKQIKQQTLNAIIDFANKHIFDEDREIDAQVTCAIEWAADEISKTELSQLSQPLPTIGEEEIPFGTTEDKKEYVYGVQINNSLGFICVCFKSINKLEDFLRCRANNIFANKVVSLFTNTDKSEKITFRCGGEEYIIEKDDINYINEEYHNSYDECYQETCVEIEEDYER